MRKRRVTRSFVPNLLTLANLFCGFASLVYSAEGNFTNAGLFILAGAFFDMFDGIAARLINAASEFGVELDSLCDLVTFGVAPSFLLYYSHFFQFGDIGLLIASLPALTGVLRLARFNVELNSLDDKHYFKGLPIPSSAIIIISYVIFVYEENVISVEQKFWLTPILVFVVSLAMVSKIKYPNVPRPSIAYIKSKPFFFIGFLIAVIASIVTKGLFILPAFMIYVIGGAIIHFIKFMKSQSFNDEEMDMEED